MRLATSRRGGGPEPGTYVAVEVDEEVTVTPLYGGKAEHVSPGLMADSRRDQVNLVVRAEELLESLSRLPCVVVRDLGRDVVADVGLAL